MTWEVIRSSSLPQLIVVSKVGHIANIVRSEHDPENAKDIATARLIAAAPDMYEALEAVVKWADELRYFSDEGTELAPVFQQARAAMLKAAQRDMAEGGR
jgi:hypothetical protein